MPDANVVMVFCTAEAEALTRRPALGREIQRAISVAERDKRCRVFGGLRIVDHYPRDDYHLAILGGNTACIVRQDRMFSLNDGQKTALLPDVEKLAAYLGYDLVKKKAVPKQVKSPDLFKA